MNTRQCSNIRLLLEVVVQQREQEDNDGGKRDEADVPQPHGALAHEGGDDCVVGLPGSHELVVLVDAKDDKDQDEDEKDVQAQREGHGRLGIPGRIVRAPSMLLASA